MKKLQCHAFNELAITILACALTLIICGAASAQSITDGSTPLGISPGAPEGSYALSDLDTVNLYNGGLSFRLPLVNIAGRGGASYTMVARIEHKWLVEKEQELGTPNRYVPNPNWWDPDGLGVLYSMGGIHLRRATSPDFYWSLSRLTFTAPDGTEFELRDQLTNGHPASSSHYNRGRVFSTSDGSNAVFTGDADIVDGPQTDEYVSGYLVMRDGTSYRIDNSLVSWLRDRNGNKLTFAYDVFRRLATVTDSLNRQVTIAYANETTTYDQITLKGFGGATRTIKVYYSQLRSALRSDFIELSYPQLFPELNGAGTPGYIPVVSAVQLPNGQQYQFYYNSFAELARVVLPTGGAMEYDYAAGLTNGAADGVIVTNPYGPGKEVYRRVIERRVYPDGGSGSSYASRTTYSRPETTTTNLGYVTTDQYNTNGTLLSRSAHYFYGSPRLSFNQQPTQYAGWKDGKEYQTVVYAANGTTPLKQVNTTFTQRAAVSWWTGGADQEPPNDPRTVETDNTLSDANLVSKQTFGYDDSVPFNNQNNVKEYDFGSGAPGALVRESRTIFITSSTYTNTDVSLLSLPSQTSVFDSNGIERARTNYEYDNYTPDTNHASLVDRASISGLDSAFTTSYATRGNGTASTHYLLVNGTVTGSITAYAQFDIAGNVIKAIDGRGYATTLDYRDNFGAPTDAVESSGQPTNSAPAELAGLAAYGFPFAVTNALGQTVYAKFDYYLGRPVDSEDANGVVSSAYYGDLLDRSTQVIRAANQGADIKSQSTFAYDDANRVITTTSDQNSYGDNLLKGQMVYDGLGRTIESRHYEGGTNYIAAQTQYDALGRAFKASNPFRPWNNETAVWTTSAFDALGRIVTITTPDNAVVTTSYSGNTVTVSDQAGKQRKSVTDGLGRLIQVYEAPNDSNYNYLTSYSYDALNDLTTVNQSSQTRSFLYDSLKRLTSAMNPESGTVTYDYDNNGNLLHRTDARSITTTLAYDALNRPTTRSYQNDPNGTPPVNYFYDSQTPPPGAPTFSSGYATGRLVAVTYGSGNSAGDYYGYDALGRQTLKIQQTGGVNYQTSAIYNLANELTTETYPSNRTVTNAYDSAGRTTSVTGYLGDGTQRTYSTGIIYDAASRMAKEQFGTATAVYNKLFYNVRGQLSEIRESTSYTGPTDTTWDRGAIINNYSLQAGCVGASCSATDNNGNLMKQSVYIPGSAVFSQFYGYDSLNRLQSVREDGPPGPANWQQAYTYDQYGNRKMNTAATWGSGVNSMQAAVDPNTATNRMYAPGETDQNHSLINYDNAGNQTKDYYSDSASGEGYDRTYDAENRMKSSTATYSSPAGTQTSTYTYDGGGRRVKRNIAATETWQVYGLGGELLAEYGPNTSPLSPQKEYGYRNGQLLITATAPSGLAANILSGTKAGALAIASSSVTESGAANAGARTPENEPKASLASAVESGASKAGQPYELLASIKGLMLPQWSGIGFPAKASTEAVSDTSTPLYGPSFPYASLNRSAIPLMPQSGSAQIAFASNRDGSAQIYSMNTDGSGPSRLTNDAANDEAPNWSPNNSRIVFQSDRDNLFSGIADIYVMNWDGSGQTRLTNDPADDSAPVWSPDGTKIAFQSARNGVSYQVYVMNADGSGQVNISNSTANDTQPWWSPDGSKIAFAADRDQAGFSSVYVMNANGTNQTRLTNSGTGLLDQQPAWSPDSSKLTFTSTRDSIVQTWQETDDNGGIVTKSKLLVNKEVYVMNANGSAQVRLTNTLENDDSASWSGDGTKIVFRSDRERDCCDPTEQVWVMNADGSSQVDLSNNGLADHCPSWSHAANVPPAVSLTSPTSGAIFTAPANITITANASDSDGSINRVDFYQGVTLIGTATASPYTISWNSVTAGTYSLTARATDNLGAQTNSSAVSITVNAPPTVSITSPASGASFTAPANITVTANASDSDGSVSRVDFYQGSTLIGTATASPYTISWSNVTAGSYSLTARATDNLGATTASAAVSITVNAPPTVSITAPTNGASFASPANITITANASDSDGSISRVDFYQGTTLIGTATTSPYNVSWNNVTTGTYSVTAKATDNLGAQTNSTVVNITVITAVADVRWIVSDQLGTPRMIFDQTGSLANVSRHDYLPFGEELTAGGRTAALGYGGADGARQKFTLKERDNETGLDYSINRYYSSIQGRFTSADPLMASGITGDPQSWNRYTYALNNPLRFTDPDGQDPTDYYDLDGKKIGQDGVNDGKIAIVYDKDEANNIKNTQGDYKGSPKSVINIPSAELIDPIANTVTLSNKATADDKKGGFHENGITAGTVNGKLETNNFVGPVGNVGVGAEITMTTDEHTQLQAHDHPAGVGDREVTDNHKNDPIGTRTVSIEGRTSQPAFEQRPSDQDVGNALPHGTNIVVGARDNTVYFYGVRGSNQSSCNCIAKMSLKNFSRIGKSK